MEQWFVFDLRKQFQNYEASFANHDDAVEWADQKLGEHAYITREFRLALVRPQALNPKR